VFPVFIQDNGKAVAAEISGTWRRKSGVPKLRDAPQSPNDQWQMENDKWQMSRAKPARYYLSFIIFHLSFVIFSK